MGVGRKRRAAADRAVGMNDARSQFMKSSLPVLVFAPLLLCAGASAAPSHEARAGRTTLKVCSDPNNLPFSNEKQEGFENRIAELVARDMGATLEYTWWVQRRGYIRNSLRARKCDVMIGVPTGLNMLLTTRPYYRSTYAFVSRKGLRPVESFEDPRLKTLRVGVQIIGDDFANSPPAHALSHRGIVTNVRGYTVIGNYREPNPPSRIIHAVEKGEIDVGIAWGPLAGYFAKKSSVPLRVTPVSPQIDVPYLPFVFDIAMGVRRGESAFRDSLDNVLMRRKPEIDRILTSYGVPLVR